MTSPAGRGTLRGAPVPYDFDLSWPLRSFVHDDGRRVEARVDRCEIVRVIYDAEGDRTERREAFADSDAAERALDSFAWELKRDRFREVTAAPPPLASLDRCLALWRDEDPELDAAALEARVRACASPSPEEVFGWIERLADRRKALPEPGAWQLVYEFDRQSAARYWLSTHREAIYPALLLSLRFGSYSVEMSVDSLLCEDPRHEAWGAVLSTVLRPSRSVGGGRWSASDTLRQLGKPPAATLPWLLDSLRHDHFGVRQAARDLLAFRAAETAVYAALWPLRDGSREAEEAVVTCLERLPNAAARSWVASLSKRWRKKAEKARLAALLAKL